MTIGNLLCGCAGIWALFNHQTLAASYFIWLAAVLDFGDGFVARALKAQSNIGKELDSLADNVTFGVLPALMAGYYLNLTFGVEPTAAWPGALCLPIAACSALRLAIFNVDTRQTYGFIGVPTPANALLWSALPFLFSTFFAAEANSTLFYGLLVLVAVQSWLLVSPLPLLAMKFGSAGLSMGQRALLPAVLVSAVGGAWLAGWGGGIAAGYLAYLAVSIVFPYKSKQTSTSSIT